MENVHNDLVLLDSDHGASSGLLSRSLSPLADVFISIIVIFLG